MQRGKADAAVLGLIRACKINKGELLITLFLFNALAIPLLLFLKIFYGVVGFSYLTLSKATFNKLSSTQPDRNNPFFRR
jgi:hypothetical protein